MKRMIIFYVLIFRLFSDLLIVQLVPKSYDDFELPVLNDLVVVLVVWKVSWAPAPPSWRDPSWTSSWLQSRQHLDPDLMTPKCTLVFRCCCCNTHVHGHNTVYLYGWALREWITILSCWPARWNRPDGDEDDDTRRTRCLLGCRRSTGVLLSMSASCIYFWRWTPRPPWRRRASHWRKRSLKIKQIISRVLIAPGGTLAPINCIVFFGFKKKKTKKRFIKLYSIKASDNENFAMATYSNRHGLFDKSSLVIRLINKIKNRSIYAEHWLTNMYN